MSRVKLNLVSGSIQEREVITSFKYNDVKYVIFDGESTGSMGLPIILVCKEVLGKVVGITDAEEWKNTKECLKKIISGEKVEYASVSSELKADDIYYRQLTLPVTSFDALKSSYVTPGEVEAPQSAVDNTPVFEQIAPEDITNSDMSSINPVSADSFSAANETENQEPQSSDIPFDISNMNLNPVQAEPAVDAPVPQEEAVAVQEASTDNYSVIKEKFMNAASQLFDDIYNEINHND